MRKKFLLAFTFTILGPILAILALCTLLLSRDVLAVTLICIFLIIAGIAITIVGLVMNYNPTGYKEKIQTYTSLPYKQITDFKAEIEKIREKYNADNNSHKNEIQLKPPFIGDKKIRDLFDYKVLKNGKIYYALLLKANTAVFNKSLSTTAAPGILLYNTGEYYDSHPEELLKLEDIAYSSRELARKIDNDYSFFSNFKAPNIEPYTTEDKKQTYITTAILPKEFMPSGKLDAHIIPIIAAPDTCDTVHIVDPKYWSDELIADFCYKNRSIALALDNISTIKNEETEKP